MDMIQKKKQKERINDKIKKKQIIQNTQRSYFKHAKPGEVHAQHQMS